MTEQTLSSARTILATPRAIFRAFIDPDVATIWRVPEGLTARVLDFDARMGGGYKIALAAAGDGGAAPEVGTLESEFVELLAHEKIVESVAFRRSEGAQTDRALVTTTLTPIADGTKVSLSIAQLHPCASDLRADALVASILKKLANLLE